MNAIQWFEKLNSEFNGSDADSFETDDKSFWKNYWGFMMGKVMELVEEEQMTKVVAFEVLSIAYYT